MNNNETFLNRKRKAHNRGKDKKNPDEKHKSKRNEAKNDSVPKTGTKEEALINVVNLLVQALSDITNICQRTISKIKEINDAMDLQI